MNRRPVIKTTKKEIVDYWKYKVDESDISVDWAEAEFCCWRCGCEKRLERCHIIPYSLGGRDDPSNFVLLCKRCHGEGPNVNDIEFMWDWIKAYRVPFYETFWGILGKKEYYFIYGRSFYKDVLDIFSQTKIKGDSKEFFMIANKFVDEARKDASFHFAQPYSNTSTLAGVYRMALKNMAQYYGVKFPLGNDKIKKSWYTDI